MTHNLTYTFTDDGYASSIYEYDDGNQAYTQETAFTYTAKDGVIKLKSIGVTGEEVVETYEYTIDGDEFNFNGVEFYRDGKGMPENAE